MLTLFYAPGACSMASHIVLEESGERYQPKRMDLSKGEQKTADYLKIHPLGRVPALKLDDGSPLTENTAILPFLGKRFGLWPTDPLHDYLKQIDGMYAGREWLSDKYSVLDPYALVFYAWGKKRELPVAELKNYTALKDRMAKLPAVQRVVADEGVKL